MKTEIKVIKLLIKAKTPKTIREISQDISSDYRITYIAVQRLLKKNVLVSKTVGPSCLCSLNESYYGIEIYKAEHERSESLLKNKDLLQLYREIMSALKTSFFVFLVFGSYGKGRQTKNSDIDVLFVSNEKGFEEKISITLSLLPLKVHALVFTEAEFVRMRHSRKSNVVQEALLRNVVLYGVESYYRLKNA